MILSQSTTWFRSYLLLVNNSMLEKCTSFFLVHTNFSFSYWATTVTNTCFVFQLKSGVKSSGRRHVSDERPMLSFVCFTSVNIKCQSSKFAVSITIICIFWSISTSDTINTRYQSLSSVVPWDDRYILMLFASTWRVSLMVPYPVIAEITATTAKTVPMTVIAKEKTFYRIKASVISNRLCCSLLNYICSLL